MEPVKLPTEKAHEPAEEAHQPATVCDSGSTMSSQEEANKPKKRHATFAENVMSTEKELSQNSSTYKEALSQPAPGISHRQRLAWLQRRRGPGLWVQCDACNSWRHLPHVVDSYQLPPKWYCSMNPDKSMADCSAPEAPLRITDEEDLIHSEYSAGSLVWARLPGWPWWPAMVDDCPDTEQFYWLDGFSDIPTHYNVVFFDATGVTRAWIAPENLKPYTSIKKNLRQPLYSKQYKKRLENATKEADKAEKLPVVDRLARYSFISTYKGPIMSPKKVSKSDLERYQNKLKRKFNVDFPIEVSSESEEESIQAFRESNKRKNVILIGTPRSRRTKRADIYKKDDDKTVFANPNQRKKKINLKTKYEEKDDEGNSMQKPLLKQDSDKKSVNTGNEFKSPKKLSEVANKKTSIFSAASTAPAEICEQPPKLPDSLSNEIGSTQTLNLGSEIYGIDNDSSKTYVPEDETDPVIITQDFQVLVETPSSDDFDF